MASLFISYSRKDKDAARELTEAFKGEDLDFWIDWEGIEPTVDWWREIEKGIEEADNFLFLLSPDSASSKVCRQEIEHAVKNGKRLIPIVVRDLPADQSPVQLRPVNWIFLRETDDFQTAFGELITAVKTDYDWVEFHRNLQVRALEWERDNHENSLLLRGKDLQDTESELAINGSKEPHPTDLQRQYVLTSRQASDRQRRRLFYFVMAAALVMTGLAVFGFVQARLANTNAKKEQAASTLANENANIALARQLVAQAQSIFATQNSKQMISVLLAVQSMKIFPSLEAEQILQNNVLARPITRMTHDDRVKIVALSPDGKYVVSGSDDKTARVWEITTGNEIARITYDESSEYANSPVLSVAFSPDGKYVVSRGYTTARVWEAATGKEIARMDYGTFSESIPYTVAFSPDGKYVVSGGNITVSVWEAATGKEIARMTHDMGVLSVAFSPDGKYVVSSSYDNTARVWEVATGKEIARMTHDDPVNTVAFNADGKYVVSGSDDHTVRVWIYRPEDTISDACFRVTRNLTRAEWKHYIGNALPYRAVCPNLPIEPEAAPIALSPVP